MAKRTKATASWERQPNESRQAYEAFITYLKMGPKRSITKVEQELNKSRGLIGRWSSAWKWQDRSKDYDAELLRAEVEAEKEEIAKMRKRQTQTAMLMQKKAVEALNNLPTESLTPKDIKEFIKIATDLERLNRNVEDRLSDKEVTGTTLADTVIAAYQKRRGDNNA